MGLPGAPASLNLGGATSSGPADGIYHVEVESATVGASRQKGTPYFELALKVTAEDKEHKDRAGKVLLKQRFYVPKEDAPDDKKQTMFGMLRRGAFKGFGVAWPKELKSFDPRVFVKKKAFIVLGKQKPQEGGGSDADDLRSEVKLISQDREVLEKYVSNAKETPAAGGETIEEKPKKVKAEGTSRR